VLDFPFKDCVLEGGQSTEEGVDTYFEYDEEKTKIVKGKKVTEPAGYKEKQAKRKEVFFNQVLAHDEIDRLFEKKALVNWKRFTKDSDKKGETVKEIKRDENGLIKENLVIKGNNLLALHSLKSEFAGKIKLIYIDPPYNTENDGFVYNDNFNHSAWLTFMKNRLEVAKELLSDDGTIYIQLDYNEVHYFKVLMDEIFGRQNFQREIIWDMTVLSGYKTLAKNWIRGHDSILFYSKNSKNFKFNKLTQPHTKDYEKMFNKTDKDGRKYMVAHGITRYWDEVKDKGKPFGDVWNDVMSFQQQPTSSERIEFDGQKPEKLLERIIRSATDEGDIVLDFFGGTGTTSSVAIKLKRQAITVEQMEYIDTKLKNRLIETIAGKHNSVLSKSVKWKGGGSFIYCELAKWNEQAKTEISKAKNLGELVKLLDDLYEKYFLNYNVRIKDFKEKIVKEETFKNLSLKEQKLMFLTMLDLNQMYVQESEMADKRFGISKEDQMLTKEFYKK
jgi:adenine-specific DNA-methyltransferase